MFKKTLYVVDGTKVVVKLSELEAEAVNDAALGYKFEKPFESLAYKTALIKIFAAAKPHNVNIFNMNVSVRLLSAVL